MLWGGGFGGTRKLFEVKLNSFDVYFTVFLVENNLSVLEGEKGEVATTTHIAAGLVFGSALTHDYVARYDAFATELFYSEALAIAVAAVVRSALSFFMSHGFSLFLGLLGVDGLDFNH